MAKELLALVDAGTIRVIDVLILTKNEDGSVDAMELSEIEQLGDLQAIEAELAELLTEEDVANLAAAMDPGSGRLRSDESARSARYLPMSRLIRNVTYRATR